MNTSLVIFTFEQLLWSWERSVDRVHGYEHKVIDILKMFGKVVPSEVYVTDAKHQMETELVKNRIRQDFYNALGISIPSESFNPFMGPEQYDMYQKSTVDGE